MNEMGKLEEIAHSDDDGGNGQFLLTMTLEKGVTYVYRISFYNEDEKGTIDVLFSQGLIGNATCLHENDFEYLAVLLPGAQNCEDGCLSVTLCKDCGTIQNVEGSDYHQTVCVERINLDAFSECGGFVYCYSCACGEETSIDYELWWCDGYWNYNSY